MKAIRIVVMVVLFAGVAIAGDWPGWRGPERTDVSREKGLLSEWPKEGPTRLWILRKACSGYSGFTVVGDRLYCCVAAEENEYMFAWDTKKVDKLWSDAS